MLEIYPGIVAAFFQDGNDLVMVHALEYSVFCPCDQPKIGAYGMYRGFRFLDLLKFFYRLYWVCRVFSHGRDIKGEPGHIGEASNPERSSVVS